MERHCRGSLRRGGGNAQRQNASASRCKGRDRWGATDGARQHHAGARRPVVASGRDRHAALLPQGVCSRPQPNRSRRGSRELRLCAPTLTGTFRIDGAAPSVSRAERKGSIRWRLKADMPPSAPLHWGKHRACVQFPPATPAKPRPLTGAGPVDQPLDATFTARGWGTVAATSEGVAGPL